MEKCKKCGAEILEGENFCKDCGTPVNNEQEVTQNSGQTIDATEVITTPVPSETENVENTKKKKKNDEEELLNAYIGKNIEGIKNETFSWCFFFFGSLYLLYRKMWLYGFGLIFGLLILYLFLPILGSIASFGATILFSIKFKEWYIQDAKDKINQIKTLNPGKSTEELKAICKKKGGTTIIPVIVFAILVFIVPGVLYFVLSADSSIGKKDENKVVKLVYDLPEDYKAEEYNSDTYKSYAMPYDKYNTCRISIETHPAYLYENDPEVFLNDNIYFKSTYDIEKDDNHIVNNIKWFYITVDKEYSTEYHYATYHDENIYDIEYDDNNDETECKNLNDKIVSSMRFEE